MADDGEEGGHGAGGRLRSSGVSERFVMVMSDEDHARIKAVASGRGREHGEADAGVGVE